MLKVGCVLDLCIDTKVTLIIIAFRGLFRVDGELPNTESGANETAISSITCGSKTVINNGKSNL
jgi:hypothetical protein